MYVTYFFRKPLNIYHSIEELFSVLQNHLPDYIHFRNYIVKYSSKNLRNMLKNALEVRKQQGEVNHITGDIHYIALFLKKNRTILTIHDLVPLTRGNIFKRALIRFIWYEIPVRQVKYITVISHFTKRELLKKIRIPSEKIKVIPNTISRNIQFSPKPFNNDKPVLLQIGTKKNKNLLRVAKALRGIECHLSILGKLSQYQKNILHEYNIEYSNLFNLNYKEVIQTYRDADVVLFVSTYEGFGVPILEANALGRPVICSNVTSLPEVAGDAALLVNPYSVEEIHEAIREVVTNEKLRDDLINKGRENVKHFQPNVISRQYAELYKTVAEEAK